MVPLFGPPCIESSGVTAALLTVVGDRLLYVLM